MDREFPIVGNPDELFDAAVQRGEISDVKEILKNGNCDVNKTYHSIRKGEWFSELILLWVFKRIRFRLDRFFKIASLLLENPSLDLVLARTVLHELCGFMCFSAVGIELLLSKGQVNVNQGNCRNNNEPPLYSALSNIEKERDYFYKAAKCLLAHPDIDVNAECGHGFGNGSILSKLCCDIKSNIGVKLLLQDSRLDAYKGNPMYVAADKGKCEALQLFLNDERFDVNHEFDSTETAPIAVACTVRSMESSRGKAMQMLVEAGVNLNTRIPHPRIDHDMQTVLLYRVLKSNDATQLCHSTKDYKVLEYLLCNGADPNLPQDLLALAVNNCSLGICRLLLEHGASPNSAFCVQLEAYLDPRLDESYQKLIRESKETALHAAYRLNSRPKIDLLFKFRANTDILWMGETPKQVGKRYSWPDFVITHSHKIPRRQQLSSSLSLKTVKNCRKFMREPETKIIFQSVFKTVKVLCDRVAQILQLNLKVDASGSFYEDTKCFSPDEFDFLVDVIDFKGSIIEFDRLVKTCCLCMDSVIRKQDQISLGKLQVISFLHKNKIGSLHCVWNGERPTFRHLNISVDVTFSSGERVSKVSRHVLDKEISQRNSPRSDVKLKQLPTFMKNGFILAKAVRISSISQPRDIYLQDLTDNVKVDDVITSYLLKTCLLYISRWGEHDFGQFPTPFQVALTIFATLSRDLAVRKLNYADDGYKDCNSCESEMSCCKKMKLMLAIVQNILDWLKKHEKNLRNIDFVDEIDFYEEAAAATHC